MEKPSNSRAGGRIGLGQIEGDMVCVNLANPRSAVPPIQQIALRELTLSSSITGT